MNIELKPIAESKIRQLGGDVCGVLVRKDGRLAAVDEHGRVRWLNDAEEAEAKGRVLMDMCRFWKARVTELSEALQVAVDTPELGGGTWYDMAVAALAERAGGEK